ncbi:MAG: hypothetical protein ACYC9J_01915 [Sulfuricaulis sp.]
MSERGTKAEGRQTVTVSAALSEGTTFRLAALLDQRQAVQHAKPSVGEQLR